MSYRVDSANERVFRAEALPDPATTGLTVCGWFRTRVQRDDAQDYWRTGTAGDGTIHTVGSDLDGLDVNVFTTSGNIVDTYVNAVDEWVHIAVVDDGGSVTQYVTPVGGSILSQSATIGTGQPAQICIGGRSSTDATEWFNGAFAYVRVFDAVLTQNQVEAERDSASAVLAAWADWPLTTATDLSDASGNGRNLTAVASGATTEGDPPVGGDVPPIDMAIPLRFYTVLNELVMAVNDALAGTPGGLPDRVCVVPGLIAWDECDCGLLAGTIVQTYYTENFPQPLTVGGVGSSPCKSSFIAADLLISLIRCAPSPQGNDLAPDCEKLDEAAQIWTIDAYYLQQTVACRLEEMQDNNEIVDYLVGALTAQGPEGGCVGSDLTFTVGLDNHG